MSYISTLIELNNFMTIISWKDKAYLSDNSRPQLIASSAEMKLKLLIIFSYLFLDGVVSQDCQDDYTNTIFCQDVQDNVK